MSKVDIQYLSHLREIINVGNEKQTRSGSVKSRFGAHMSFDMTEGLPILTSKKMYTKGIIHELLWFLKGDTNIKYLVDNNVNIWTDDAYRWYKYNHALATNHTDKIINYTYEGFVDRIKSGSLGSVGIPNYCYGDLGKIYGYKWRNNTLLKYGDTTTKIKVVDADDCVDKSTVNTGVTYENSNDSCNDVWYKVQAFVVWQKFMRDEACTVSKRWSIFENFLADIHRIPFFYEFLRNTDNYVLDTSYYRSKHYSLETCVFLHKKEQELVQSYIKPNDGESGYVLNPFKIKHTDQIQNIIDTLKNNPDDRRMICVSYDPQELDDVALPPCHIMFQVYTRLYTEQERARIYYNDNDKYETFMDVPTRELSLMFYCRSQDFPLGTPYNITSYALLAHMIAHVAGMGVGDLLYMGGDVHVYDNQTEGVNTQLGRHEFYKYKLPTLTFARKVDNINDFKYEDFIISDYESEGVIKFPLSVG
ncbi:MAG: thymidylate synthase [Bacteroidales bacterium]